MRVVQLLFVCLVAIGRTAGHPLCFVDDRSTDYDQVLTFCPAAQDGACCTDAEELAVKALFEDAGTLSDFCADLYKQVVCGVCHSYSAHLYERLGSELGGADGMSMKDSFCQELVKECDGEILFPTYDGLSYCEKHVGDDGDMFWSYPYTEPEIFDAGLTEVFPDLDNEIDFPEKTLSIHQSPDGSMYWLMGQEGEVKTVDVDNLDSISSVVDIARGEFYSGFEEGLLDFAFGPMFGIEGYPQFFYLSYTCQFDDGELQRNRLSKFEYFPGDPIETRESEEVLITSSPRFSDIHAAGWCGFKPSDYGKEASYHDIYWATGDSGPQTDPLNNSQNTSNILGSIIRISVPSIGDGYLIPPGNLGDSADALPEICANGFRNPFRCGFDRKDDTLYCGDVGHSKVEEVDIIECGKNYGWSRFEGTRCQKAVEERDGPCAGADRSGFEFPYYEYCHVDYYSDRADEYDALDGIDICGDRLITGHAIIGKWSGGYVYRGTYFADLIDGAYIFGDSTNRNIYYIKDGGDRMIEGSIVSDLSVAIISFSEDVNGEIMMITKTHNIYHMPCGDLCDLGTTCLAQADSEPSYQDLGCFVDDVDDRVLDLAKSMCEPGQRTMSAAICASHCATIPGAVYAGVQFSYECFCGDDNTEYSRFGSSTNCVYPCAGTDNEMCGGSHAIQVYELG